MTNIAKIAKTKSKKIPGLQRKEAKKGPEMSAKNRKSNKDFSC